ncbi:AAA family ATPase, partial [Escherichia coli]
MKLKLKNVTSYHKEYFTELDLSKKINILYGQNGCGKSTISNYFYNPKDTAYKECVCEPIDNYRTLVYNSKYIEDNFYNAKEQKGIFTLSQKNAEIEKILSEKEELNKSLAHQHKEKKEFIEKLHEAKNKKEQECINSIWNKTKDIRSSELKQLMKGQIGSKATFYYHLKKYTPQTDIDIKSLIQSYSKLLEFKGKEIPLIT